VGILIPPPENAPWFCSECKKKRKKTASASSSNAPPAEKRQKSIQLLPVRQQANILHSAVMKETATDSCEKASSTEDFDISPNERLSPTSAVLLDLRRQAFQTTVDTTTAALWERTRLRKEKEGKEAN
jgi:hypothetical protein